ncbi:MAG: hypothetical protein ACXWFZ_10460 [Nitrososphaeraceae archaeon]
MTSFDKVPISKALYDEINNDLITALFKHKDKLSMNDFMVLVMNLASGVIEMQVHAVKNGGNRNEPIEVLRAAATENAIETFKEIVDSITRRNLK